MPDIVISFQIEHVMDCELVALSCINAVVCVYWAVVTELYPNLAGLSWYEVPDIIVGDWSFAYKF